MTRIPRSKIEEFVKETLINKLIVDESECEPHATLSDDLGADSVDCEEIMMELEEEYGIDIPEETRGRLRTVKDLVDYLDNRGLEA